MTAKANPCAWTLAETPEPWNGVRVMSTFSCGGGSSMGYRLAGCDVVAANDIDPVMAASYKKNLNPKLYYLCPIADLLTCKLPDELFGIDILDGSPPCSTFSMSGDREDVWGKDKVFREGQAKQVLSDLFFDWVKLVERLRPKVAIAENVRAMLFGNARGYVRQIVSALGSIGYRVQVFLVNAADCGVPQRRERVFFVCSRIDLGVAPLKFAPCEKWVTAGEATSDVQALSAAEIAATKPTETHLKWWGRVRPGRSFHAATGYSLFNWYRLSGDEPTATISTHADTFSHWSECRKLTLREVVRFGSFPEDYIFKSRNAGIYIIGMSVPPKMTAALARAVCEQWFGVNYEAAPAAGP